MGDHFVLLVDRLITESTLEAAIQSRNRALVGPTSLPSVDLEAGFAAETMNLNDGTSDRKLVECRICQEEDEVSSMETPCSCCGSLKYAHRKCVQRWCNEKGDTICEICLQQFKPGYSAPPQLFHYGGIPMNFRGNWEIPRRDLHNSPFIAMVATDRELMGTDRELMGSDYDDYSASSTRSLMYCRSVAVIFMVLLVLRHTLPVILSGAEQDAFAIISLLMLRTAGILLPIYVMARALITFRRWRHQQEIHELSLSTSEGDSGHSRSLQQMQPQPHLIHVH